LPEFRIGEEGKQERLYWVGHKALFGLFAVLVHHISDHSEVEVSFRVISENRLGLADEPVSFGVAMGEAKYHHALDHLLALIGSEGLRSQEVGSEDVGDEALEKLVHLLLAHLRKAFVSEVSVLVHAKESNFLLFVELAHVSEDRAREKEVPLRDFVLFRLLAHGLLSLDLHCPFVEAGLGLGAR